MIRYRLTEVHEAASRLHGILVRSGNARVAIGAMRDAADEFAEALEQGAFLPQESCDIENTLFQLHVFLTNVGTGVQSSGEMHPASEAFVISHVATWTTYFHDMAAVLEQGSDINAWLIMHPIPSGQPGMLSESVGRVRRARAETSARSRPVPQQPAAPKLTRKFMCRHLPITRTMANKNEPAALQVELVDGELNYISEDLPTVFVTGDPVMLPASPCISTVWDQWLKEFWQTHAFLEGENIRYNSEASYVIREVGK